jgi:GrpB-like predicted nucleotidyltransferase (UPF0157 family)
MTQVIVLPYDPKWRAAFQAEAALIADLLGENAPAIHHIGSTSIPGICAKPVIDILIEFTEVSAIEARNAGMIDLGYEVMGEFGIPGRRYYRKDNGSGVRTHQVHAFQAGSEQVIRHLAFRDYLIAHPERAAAYSDLKRQLAAQHPDSMDDYIAGKDAFIKETDRSAEQWRAISRNS